MKCTWGTCPREAAFNWVNQPAKFCDYHKHPWMIDTSIAVGKTNPLSVVKMIPPPPQYQMTNPNDPVYRVALLGDRASGKTSFMRFIKGNPLDTLKDNKYRSTAHTEVHPLFHNSLKIDIWETGKFSCVEKFPLMYAIIVVSNEKSAEKVTVNLHGPIPVITVYNRKYRMTHDDALTALDRTAEVLTR